MTLGGFDFEAASNPGFSVGDPVVVLREDSLVTGIRRRLSADGCPS